MIPLGFCTERLLIRPWRADDAEALHPILVANYERLAPWIPPRVATPAPLPALAERLAGFAAEFDADREWRFAILRQVVASTWQLPTAAKSATGFAPMRQGAVSSPKRCAP